MRDFYLPYLAVRSQGTAKPRKLDPYGYRSLPALSFEPEELAAVAEAAARVRELGDPLLAEHAESAMRKLACDRPVDAAGRGDARLVPPRARATPLFVAVSETLRSWLKEKWPPGNEWFAVHGSATVQLNDGTTLIWEPWENASRSFLDFTMRQPSSGTSAYEWRTRVTLLAEGAKGVLQLRIENTGPEFGHAGAELTMRPRLVSLLGLFCEAACDGRTWQSKAERPTASCR